MYDLNCAVLSSVVDRWILAGSIDATSLRSAAHALQTTLQMSMSDIVRTAAIKQFEMAFELSWKTLRRVEAHLGVLSNSPREVLREAGRLNLVADVAGWLRYLDVRNECVHSYNEAIANAVWQQLPGFVALWQQLERELDRHR